MSSTPASAVSSAASAAPPPGLVRRRISGTALTVLTWLLVVVFFFPIAWMVFTAFKSEPDAATFPPTWTPHLTLDRFAAVFDRGAGPYLLNSLWAAGGSTVLVLLLAVPASYGLAVRRVKRWQDVLFFFISTRFMPLAAVIIPLYLLLEQVHGLDNVWWLLVLYAGVNMPIAIWMMRSFFAEVPREVVEAAQLDGARFRTELWRVAVPMVLPGLAAAGLICFIFGWNEYFLANLLTSSVARTAPPFLGGFVDGRGQFLAVLSAASTLAVLPVVAAGWLAQKRLVRGLAMGAIK